MSRNYLFTSESVTEGHPDKVADRVSDSVLDAILSVDPNARVACETSVNTGLCLVFGEITTTAKLDYQQIVREAIIDIGYDNAAYGFDGNTCAVMSCLDPQSPDIAMGVDPGGAGDQGLMFGYACDETVELMPITISTAHKLTYRLSQARKNGEIDFLRPDGKSQVTVEYKNGLPSRIDAIVISTQHDDNIEQEDIRKALMSKVIGPVVPESLLDNHTKYFINPTGRFVVGGPQGDSGLTGRKIIVDTYGGVGRHGGGAFSGKDATKVDRSASYMARHIAKNLVAAGAATRLEIQLAYAIGVAEPVSVMVETFGTNRADEEKISHVVRELFPLTPKGIIDYLELRRPIFAKTSAYGHFGRMEPEFTWEQLNRVDEIRKSLELKGAEVKTVFGEAITV